MDRGMICCPVCTLYLREGITLQSHLDTHPKEQVIEALLKLTAEKATSNGNATQNFSSNQSLTPEPRQQQFVSPQTHMTTVTYQQFMSSNGASTVVPQYIQVPTIVTPNSGLPLFPGQGVQYVPSSIHYSNPSFNPLYNPYIPHPYPVPQSVQVNTSYPVSVSSQSYMNSVPGQVSVIANSNLYQQSDLPPKNALSKQQCTIATNTNLDDEVSVSNVETSNDKNSDRISNRKCEESTSEKEKPQLSTVITMLKHSSLVEEKQCEDVEILNYTASTSYSGTHCSPPSTPSVGGYSDRSNFTPNLGFEETDEFDRNAQNDCENFIESPKGREMLDENEVIETVANIKVLEDGEMREELVICDDAEEEEEEKCEVEQKHDCNEFALNDNEPRQYEEVKSVLSHSNHSDDNNQQFYFDETHVENFEEEENSKYLGYVIEQEEDIEQVTYTDLQPATSTHMFEEVRLKPETDCSNYMDIDGVRIFFSSEQVKWDNFTSSTEDEQQNEKSVDSNTVIQLVGQKSDSVVDFKSDMISTDFSEDRLESSPPSLNIQADEIMPAKGELSEQESLGADNSNWALSFHGEASYDRKQTHNADDVSLISYTANSNRCFKCSLCNLSFSCPKERRVHKNSVHVNIKKGCSLKEEGESNRIDNNKLKLFKCNCCDEMFSSPKLRRQHMVSNNHFIIPKPIFQKKVFKKEVITVNKTSFPQSVVQVRRTEIKNEERIEIKHEDPIELLKPCSHCNKLLPNFKKLKEHLKLVHGEMRFQCSTCFQYFQLEEEYNAHLKIHPFKCSQCDKLFYRKPNLSLHMKRHLKVKPYECHLCPKSFITRQKLEEHVNGHSGKKPLKCSLCDRCFSRHSNLIQHRNVHHLKMRRKVKDFVCRCGEVFHSRRKLEWHREVHETKPKTCSFCTQKFIHNASLTRHIRRSHMPDYLPGENREVENIECPVCKKIYLRSSLMVHMRVHSGDKPFSCKICNKRFSTKWNLEVHTWTHQSRNSMPYKCSNCKSAFFRESDFNAHLNSHKNYKPFSCNICGQRFIRKYNCLRHQQEHRVAKQYVCTVVDCGKTFHRSYYLKDHLKVHTGVRPYSCHICGKASSTKSNHNKHVRIHDTREPVNTEN